MSTDPVARLEGPGGESEYYSNPIARDGDFADPFVLRHDGRYYLYCTNPDLRCWSSDSLLEWHPEGPAIDPDEFPGLVPFAPEVVYRDGAFYMYTSPSGHGHFVLRAERPTGPFRAVTGNVGHAIDGHVFLDDDGRSYFYWAGDEGIWGCEMLSPTEFGEPQFTGAHMNGWTEGPLVVKRNGRYHMTLTGNHYLSAGYRIDAAVSDNPLTGYRGDPLNPVLVSTTGPLVGLGHSSSVIGPDLVSSHLIYHNLNADHSRDLDIDRQVWNGDSLQILGPSLHAIAPRRAAHAWRAGQSPTPFDGHQLDDTGVTIIEGSAARWLTGDLGSVWTAELCLTTRGRASTYWIRSIGGAVSVLIDAHTAQLTAFVGSESATVALGFSPRPFALQTIGLEYDTGRLTVQLDNRRILILEGQVGNVRELEIVAERDDVLISSAAVSRMTAAQADQGLVIPVPGRFWAALTGASCPRVAAPDVSLSVDALELDSGALAVFDLLVAEPGEHLIALVGCFDAGSVVAVRVGGAERRILVNAPTRAIAVVLDLSERSCRLEVIAVVGRSVLTLLEVQPTGDGSVARTAGVDGHRKITIGTPRYPDYLLALVLDAPDDGRADVLFRASELADGGEGDDPLLGADFFRGYSLQLNADLVTFARHSYDETVLATKRIQRSARAARVVLRVTGGQFVVSIDGVEVLGVEDPLPHIVGSIGLRSRGGRVQASDIQILPV